MKLFTSIALLLLAGAAQSQTVWRCGTDGRSYSDSPCAEGRMVAVADTRSASDLAAARGVAEREQTLARQLLQQRKVSEAQLPTMAGIRQSQPAPAVKTAKKPSKLASKKASKPSPAAPGTWQATAPASR